MPSLRSILSLLALGSVMVDNPIPERLIKKVACLVALIVFTCVMIGALLLAAIVFGYQAMIEHGYTTMQAGGYIVGGLGVLVVISLIYSLKSSRCLMDDLKHGVKKNVPLTSHLTTEVSNIAEAFLQGLLRGRPDQPPRP